MVKLYFSVGVLLLLFCLTKIGKQLAKLNGKVIHTAELAVDYGFTDANGELPRTHFSGVPKRCRDIMSQPVLQYNLDAELN